MGMFDRIHCSYDLGSGFHNRTLQTKDMECMMGEYWLDPAGNLWDIDYTGTHDFIEIPEDEIDKNFPWNSFKSVPNGNHGRVKPYCFTGTIEVYPEKWDCHYAAYPRQSITFVWGKLCTKN